MGAVRKDGRYFVKRILLYMLILALAAVMLVPFLWMISASLKLNKDVFTYPVKWIPEKLEWSNYSKIWKEIPLLLFFKNSAKLTIIITAIQVFTSSFAAYAFAKLHFKGRDLLAMAGIYGATVYYGWKNESDGFSSGHDYDAELYSHGCFFDETVLYEHSG